MSQLLPGEAKKQTQSGSYLVSHEIKEPNTDSEGGVSLETEGMTWSLSKRQAAESLPLNFLVLLFGATSLAPYWSPSRLISSPVTL